jgi:hypothetical protein
MSDRTTTAGVWGRPHDGVRPRHGRGPGLREEKCWVIGYTGIGGDGSMNAGGFAVPDQRWRGLPWRLDPDEHWRLSYRIACDGMPDVKFSIMVNSPDGKTIKLDLQN